MKTYKCIYCFKQHDSEEKKESCQESHYDDLVFVPMLKKDLSTIAHYIMSYGKSDMTESASMTILRFFRKVR